jgi:hypothetical protein
MTGADGRIRTGDLLITKFRSGADEARRPVNPLGSCSQRTAWGSSVPTSGSRLSTSAVPLADTART